MNYVHVSTGEVLVWFRAEEVSENFISTPGTVWGQEYFAILQHFTSRISGQYAPLLFLISS